MAWRIPLGIWRHRKRILVVEDSPTTNVIVNILRTLNHDILTASRGDEALETARVLHPDLVLLDVILPDISGTVICQRLKADPSTRDIPVVYLTSKSEATIEANRAVHTADGYLTKPVSQWQLVNRVEQILRQQ